MRFKSLLLFTLFLVNLAVTKAQKIDPLLACLAQEELIFHKKKVTGPFYLLNQSFVNNISSFGGAPIKEKYLQEICRKKEKASFRLLALLVLKEKEIFSFTKASIYQQASLQTLIEGVPEIFFNFVSQAHSLYPHVHCLEQDVPQIKKYREIFKYLGPKASKEEYLRNKKELRSLFNRLDNIDHLVKKCRPKKPTKA